MTWQCGHGDVVIIIAAVTVVDVIIVSARRWTDGDADGKQGRGSTACRSRCSGHAAAAAAAAAGIDADGGGGGGTDCHLEGVHPDNYVARNANDDDQDGEVGRDGEWWHHCHCRHIIGHRAEDSAAAAAAACPSLWWGFGGQVRRSRRQPTSA